MNGAKTIFKDYSWFREQQFVQPLATKYKVGRYRITYFDERGSARVLEKIESYNPSLRGQPSMPGLIISRNLLIKMSCKRFPSFHCDDYRHASGQGRNTGASHLYHGVKKIFDRTNQ